MTVSDILACMGVVCQYVYCLLGFFPCGLGVSLTTLNIEFHIFGGYSTDSSLCRFTRNKLMFNTKLYK